MASIHLEGDNEKLLRTCLVLKPIEFERFKGRVVDQLPHPQEFDDVAVAQSAVEHAFVAKAFDHVGQRDVVLCVPRDEAHGCALDAEAASFAHRIVAESCFDGKILI